MRALFQDFLSHRAVFFDKLDQSANNIENMAAALATVVNTSEADERDPIYKKLDRLAHIGDDITHKIYLCLDRIFFTPLNRKDIHTLAGALDDIADMIHEASARLNLYHLAAFAEPVKQMTGVLLQATAVLQRAVGKLRLHNNYDELLGLCRQIKALERQADQVYYQAIADLFTNDKDAINVLKYREIYHSLETAANKCKCAADTLEVILINR